MSIETIAINRMSKDEIVFNDPESMAKFYELLIEQGQSVILVYRGGNTEQSLLVKPDFSTDVTKGTVTLRSERPL